MPAWIFKIQVSNYLYNNDIIPLVLARTQSYSLNQTLTLSYIKSEISIKIYLFAAKASPISCNVCLYVSQLVDSL